jgi:AcrR family transcriptional regulator
MPSKTFLNLPDSKRRLFIYLSLREFAGKDYDSASVSNVVREMGIAKGSVYQYFENKLDLWLYLKQHCDQLRLGYLRPVYRNNYTSFFRYYRDLQLRIVAFDRENAVASRFLYRISGSESSQDVAEYIRQWKLQTHQIYKKLIEAEKLMGNINAGIPADVGAHLLASVRLAIQEIVQAGKPEDDLSGEPKVFTDDDIERAIDDLVVILEKAFRA